MPNDRRVTLLAVPNVSEGREPETIEALGGAFADEPGVRLLDVHSDPDHNRSVFTLAGDPGELSAALLAGAREAVMRIDMRTHDGVHPCVGALDVAPVIHLDPATRGAACAEALVTADAFARELELPVLLYGVLAGGRSRASLRSGGLLRLAQRLEAGELAPDFGPRRPHPSAGVTLVGVRPPLVAFNLELAAPATEADAKSIAASLRQGGREGLPGLRAIGLWLAQRSTAQVSFNVEDPSVTSLAAVVEAVRRHARVAAAELVGLAPRSALDGFPDDLEIRGFDPSTQLIENALGL